MLPGKGGPLSLLKSKGFRVPEFLIIPHVDFVSWGDKYLYSKLIEALGSHDQKNIFSSAKEFSDSVSIPELKIDETKLYAVRSSAHLEDSLHHSFAGIFTTKLFTPKASITSRIKEIWLSLYEDKSFQYCQIQNIPWSSLQMDIIIQEMIVGDKSGILFQSNPIGKPEEQVVVAGLGLCQGIVNEETDTDTYFIQDHEVTDSQIQDKTNYLIWKDDQILREEIPFAKRKISVLNHSEIEKILSLSIKLKACSSTPLDVEFTFKDNELYILQSRPISSGGKIQLSRGSSRDMSNSLQGIPCAPGKVEAECEVITDINKTSTLQGKIIVSDKTDAAWDYFFEGIAGIISEKGSMLSHAAIISRELGIPCIVNVKNATHTLKSGMKIKMDGSTGEIEL